jgi:hypothetical protein
MKRDWIQIIEDQRLSGQTIAAYCEDHSISVATFYKHKQRHKQTPSTITFTPLYVEPELIKFKINGYQFEVDEPNMLALTKMIKSLVHD